MHEVGAGDDGWDVRDLVKPARRPRLRECAIRLRRLCRDPANPAAGLLRRRFREWTEHTRRPRYVRGRPNTSRGPNFPADDMYREWQLVGSSSSDEGGAVDGIGEEAEDTAAAHEHERILRRLQLLPSPPDNTDADINRQMGNKFVSFLLNDDGRAETRVVWLTHSQFLICKGPSSHCHTLEGTVPHHFLCFPFRFRAQVETVDGQAHELLLSGPDGGARWGGDGGDGGDGGGGGDDANDDGPWPPLLATLLARSNRVAHIKCDLDVGRHLESLRAIVGAVPPPGARRTLHFDTSGDFGGGGRRCSPVGEAEARIVAFGTHRNSAVVVHADEWGDNLAVLAEAVRTGRCPRRLILRGRLTTDVSSEAIDALVKALRVTAAVESVSLRIDDWRPRHERCYERMVEAVGRNVGVRHLETEPHIGVPHDSINGLWSSILGSPTLERVSLERVLPVPYRSSDDQKRERAIHVARLLRSNRCMTHVGYNPVSHDPAVMEDQVLPLLQLNRLRKIGRMPSEEEAEDGGAGGAGANGGAAAPPPMSFDRILPLLLRSSAVRRHPMMMYYAVRRGAALLAQPLLLAAAAAVESSSSAAAARASEAEAASEAAAAGEAGTQPHGARRKRARHGAKRRRRNLRRRMLAAAAVAAEADGAPAGEAEGGAPADADVAPEGDIASSRPSFGPAAAGPLESDTTPLAWL